jgi:hypothetical protein
MDQPKSYVPEGRPFKFCANCGAKIDKEAVICPACGISQTGSPGFGAISNANANSNTRTAEDLDGLRGVKNASLLGIIGIILSLAGEAAIEGAILSIPLSGPLSTGISLLALVGGIIGFISILLYRAAFRAFRVVDVRSFGTPYTFTTVLLAGFGILILDLLMIIGGIETASFVLVLFSSILTIIVLILLLLGVIIGIILGLWRVGSRYDNTLIKVGAIFYIIPFLDVLAPILVFIGAHSVEKAIKIVPPPLDGTVL